MLKSYVEKLLALDSVSIQNIAYINEPEAHLLSPQQKQELFLQAETCGKNMAESLRQKYGTRNIEQLTELSGGKIITVYEPPDPDYALFAYFEKPGKIIINMANVERSQQLISEYELEPMIGHVSIKDLLLSHELYHLLESRAGKNSFVQQGHVCAFQLGKFKLMRKVGCLEEIAAMSFTSNLLQMNYSPYIFNIIMLYAFHPNQAAKLMSDYSKSEECP